MILVFFFLWLIRILLELNFALWNYHTFIVQMSECPNIVMGVGGPNSKRPNFFNHTILEGGKGHTGLWCDTSPQRGLCHCLMLDYAHRCWTSTLIINFWQHSELFTKIDRVRALLINLSKFQQVNLSKNVWNNIAPWQISPELYSF